MTFLDAWCLAALAAGAPAEPQGFEALPFAFRLDATDADQYRGSGRSPAGGGTVIELQIDGPSSDLRIDVLDGTGTTLPRWRWRTTVTVRGNRAEIGGNPGTETLVVVRRPGRRDYQLEGPFRWPETASRRIVSDARFRSLWGADPSFRAGGAIALLGRPSVRDALCENDKGSRWQCLAVPVSFEGMATLCDTSASSAYSAVSPGSAVEVAFRRPAWAAAVIFTPEEALAEGESSVELNLVKPGPALGQIFLKEPGLEVTNLGPNLLWILGPSPVGDQVLQARAGKFVARLPLSALLAGSTCGQPQTIVLELEQRIFGTVYDKGGSPAPRPFLLVLEEKSPQGAQGDSTTRVVQGIDGDDSGQYSFSELLSKIYVVRACQGSLGCLEKRVVPSSEPLDFHLKPRASFKGRIVSTAGVAEPGATVRIIPTIATYGAAKDRFKFLPLATSADSDGRFQIAAPDVGRFLVEARTNDTGTARREVEVTEQSAEETDMGDVRLPPLAEFSAEVAGCVGGTLELIGPIGGATPLPSTLSFSIEPSGRAIVGLPEGGMWLLSATCAGARRTLDPSVLYKAEDLAGMNVRFSVLPLAPAQNP